MEIKNQSMNELFLAKTEAPVENKPAAKSLKDSNAGASFSAALDSKMKKAESTDDFKSEKPTASDKPKSKSQNLAAKKEGEQEQTKGDEKTFGKLEGKKEEVSAEGSVKKQPKAKVEAAGEELKSDDKKKIVVDNSLLMPFGMLPLQTLQTAVDVKAVDVEAPVQNPIAQFMVSMESELGVKPEQMLQAFQKLAPEQLLSKPEESLKSVISNLNLSAPDAEKASQMYAKMLADLGKVDQSQNALSAQDKVALMSALQGSQVIGAAGKSVELEGVKPNSKLGDKLSQLKPAGGESNSVSAKSGSAAVGGPALALEGNDSFATDSQGFSSDQSFGKFQDGKNETLAPKVNPMVQNANQEIKKGQGLSAYGVPSAVKVEQTQQAIKTESKQVELKANTGKEEAAAENSQSTSLGANPAADSQSVIGKPAMATGAAVGAAGTAGLAATNNQSAVDRNQVIQQVMDSARVLSQKGGGEMSVSLKNNELGQIHLKVAAHGNDVAISMVAEQSDTKKLLESNIRDLKLGLSQHNINADSIKVSVADNSSNNDFRQNPQQHADFGASREFAGAFQQQQKEQREAMMGFSSLGTGSALNDRIQSRRIDSVSNGQVNGRRGNSSVLNLVA